MADKILKLGVPKGSLQNATFDLFEKAGFHITGYERSYFPQIDDAEIQLIMLRAQEMSRYVEDGVLDAGFTGQDWILENKSSVTEVCQLLYSKATSNPARWVLAVPNESSIKKPQDLEGGIIATELVGVTKDYFKKKKINVKVEFSWGATEVKARLVSAIVELTETGSSIKANNLRIIDTLMSSTTRFIANKEAWKDKFKREKIENISILLNAAIDAKTTVGLKMNVEKKNLDAVLKILPAEKSPTVSPLADGSFVAIEVVVDVKTERTIVPKLKRAGASGIITYPLNKVIH
ncbi:MAG TPA: ATP phosphoribosyltransferase [Phycisphaerales bacterium]|nr:MAG: ATP phosphoribosyltransferase [Planctomycetes bacterium GWC2_45_44]HBG77326.1 ATP phosphoribosyltransferase [Phycisphaerales bacterium]HBR19673.1 ATP phosphoribosyltransferase [Phycisphaerales bacterium]